MNKKFNPKEWLPKAVPSKNTKLGAVNTSTGSAAVNTSSNSPAQQVEAALAALEAARLDLTGKSYADWVNLGFAFASEFQEQGRMYFHRVSQFHPEYNYGKCDRQYDYCLRSKGTGIRLATFFHHLKEAGMTGFHRSGVKGSGMTGFHRSGVTLSGAGGQGRISEGSSVQEARENSVQEAQGNSRQEAQGYDKIPRRTVADASRDYTPAGSDRAAGNTAVYLPDAGEQAELPELVLPRFPERLFPHLPKLLKRVVAAADTPEERDMLLLGALTCLSSCLPNLWGTYKKRRVEPNLYFFLTAPASAGKGSLGLCRNLVLPIHLKLRREVNQLKQQYEQELADFKKDKKDASEKPARPPEKMLFLPANSSATGMFQLLAENDSRGLIMETEGDTMSQTFKSEYGNYSDGFRKAFHHEPISYFRRTENEYIGMERPKLSALLSGTPRQVTSLIKDSENGLFSRFLFYFMDLEPVWLDVFAAEEGEGVEQDFLRMGEEFERFQQQLISKGEIRVQLSPNQKIEFNSWFRKLQRKYRALQPKDFVGSVRRMGLICFRLAMCLSALRMMDEGPEAPVWECRQPDFDAAMQMVEVLIRHSSHVYYTLPVQKNLAANRGRKERFFENLPAVFGRQEYLELARKLELPEKTADRFIGIFTNLGLVDREGRDEYRVI